jgi:hypothetical protein
MDKGIRLKGKYLQNGRCVRSALHWHKGYEQNLSNIKGTQQSPPSYMHSGLFNW